MDTITALMPLTTLDDLDRALETSSAKPVLIFKHSTTCGSSWAAREEVEAWLEESSHPPIPTFIVSVQGHRSLSAAIATRLKVHHESPQLLLVRGGSVLWHTSHAGVRARAITAAVRPLLD